MRFSKTPSLNKLIFLINFTFHIPAPGECGSLPSDDVWGTTHLVLFRFPSKQQKKRKIYRGYYIPARGYEFYLRVVNAISHEWAQRTSEISSWTREDKIHSTCGHVISSISVILTPFRKYTSESSGMWRFTN